MKLTSKQIQNTCEEKTGRKLRGEFAHYLVAYVGDDRNRSLFIEHLIERAAKLTFATEGERLLYIGRQLHDLHCNGPLPQQVFKEPAARSFADAHDKRVRAAEHILVDWMDRSWDKRLTKRFTEWVEKVQRDPENFYQHGANYWEAYAADFQPETLSFLSEHGPDASHGEALAYVALLQRGGGELDARPGV